MAYCVKCGAQVDENAHFCPECGAEIPQMENNTYAQEEYFDSEEVKQNKGMGVLSYLGVLVLIPLLAGNKNSAYVKHHCNQGLILFLLSLAIDLLEGKWIWGLHSWIHFGGRWFSQVFDIVDLVCFILFIMGLVSACKGTRKELPVIGKIKLVK